LIFGYTGIFREKVRGKPSAKESYSFSNPKDDSLGTWPTEEQLPGFRDFADSFYQVRHSPKLMEIVVVDKLIEMSRTYGQSF